MKPVVSMVVMGAFLAIAGSSAHAYALTPGQKLSKSQNSSSVDNVLNLAPLSPTTVDSFTNDSTPNPADKTQSKVYAFDLKGKWGVKFDVNQPETTPSGFNDIDYGAYYRLSPSVRVAGSVGFGERSNDTFKPEPNSPIVAAANKQPRVRLETTFKF